MEIGRAEFISSNTTLDKCPAPDRPEFAFIGRSNVGKSSLINMLTNHKGLAKISSKPGKTQTINHFLINNQWYLVDLPGYGYASVSKSISKGWGKMIESYILQRPTLTCLFILVDIRHNPQAIDLKFITWAGTERIPIALIFTKADKVSKSALTASVSNYQKTMEETWEELPPMLVTSADSKLGRDTVLSFIEGVLNNADLS